MTEDQAPYRTHADPVDQVKASLVDQFSRRSQEIRGILDDYTKAPNVYRDLMKTELMGDSLRFYNNLVGRAVTPAEVIQLKAMIKVFTNKQIL